MKRCFLPGTRWSRVGQSRLLDGRSLSSALSAQFLKPWVVADERLHRVVLEVPDHDGVLAQVFQARGTVAQRRQMRFLF